MKLKKNVKRAKKRRTIVFNVDVAKRRRARESRAPRAVEDYSGLWRWGKYAAAALAVTTLGILGTASVREQFHAPPRFTVRWIEVANEELLTKREIIALARTRVGDNLITADLGAIRDRLRAHPDIRDVVVSRRIPGGILIRIYERTPIATVYAGGRYVLDEEGCVLSPKREEASRALPSITGVSPGPLRAGDRLRAPAVQRALEVVKAYHETELDRQIELVSVDMADPENTVLRSNTIEEIRMGDEGVAERMQLLSFVLGQRKLRGIDGPASYLDLRWKDVAEMPARGDIVSMR